MAVALKPALRKIAVTRVCDKPRSGGTSYQAPGLPVELQTKSISFRTGDHLADLKSTAEKMMQEQAAAKANLHILSTKLDRSEQKVRGLYLRLQEVSNVSSTLKAKHAEDVKLWKVLASKHAATMSIFDQITDKLQHLEIQIQHGEQDKAAFEQKSVTFYEQSKGHIEALQMKLTEALNTAAQREADICKMTLKGARLEERLAVETSAAAELLQEMERVRKQCEIAEESLQTSKCSHNLTRSQLACVQEQLSEKRKECMKLQGDCQLLVQQSAAVNAQNKDLVNQLSAALQLKDTMGHERERLTVKVFDMETALGLASTSNNEIQEKFEDVSLKAQQEHEAKEKALYDLCELTKQCHQLNETKSRQQGQIEASNRKIAELQTSLETVQETVKKLTTEKQRLQEILQCKAEKERALESTMHDLIANKEELLRNMCHLKSENVNEVEHLNNRLEEGVQEISKLIRKNAGLLLVLKSCEQEANRQQSDSLKKSNLLDVALLKVKTTEERLKQEVEKRTLAENGLLEVKQQSELELEAKQTYLNNHLKEIAARNNKEMSDFRIKLEAETKEAMMEEELKVKNLWTTDEKEKRDMMANHCEELVKQKQHMVSEVAKAQQKVGKLEEQTTVLRHKSGCDTSQDRELKSELIKSEEVLKDNVSKCLRVQQGHRQEITSLLDSFRGSLEDSTSAIVLWESKCTSMGTKIQQLIVKMKEEKYRCKAKAMVLEDNYRKSVARMQQTFPRELNDVQLIHRRAETVFQGERLLGGQPQGLSLGPSESKTACNELKTILELEMPLNFCLCAKTRLEVMKNMMIRGHRLPGFQMDLSAHGAPSKYARKRTEKRKRNLSLCAVSVELVNQTEGGPYASSFGTELEGLCCSGGLDPYEADSY